MSCSGWGYLGPLVLRYIRIFDVCFCVDGDGVALEVGWVFVSFCVIVIIFV